MTRRHVWAVLSGVLCALWLAVPAASADSGWRQLKTPRYTVLSQLSENATRSWATEFDQFIDSTGGLMSISPARLPPLTVVLMARSKDFDPYKPPRPNGTSAKTIGGFFYRMGGWSVIGLAEHGDDDATRRTIFHESVHWLMSSDRSPQPRWFSEGIAELFSTFSPHFDKVDWGHPIEYHVLLLRQYGLMPMKDFLAQDSSFFDRDDHTGRYYAQSWALVHYLLVSGHPERREKLMRYISTFRTKSSDDAFQAAFGGDYAALQRELKDYIDQPRMGYMITPRKPAAPAGSMTEASPLVVETALGRLALSSADRSLALRHAERALALGPTDPAGHELKAYIALRDDDRATAQAEAERALSAGSQDSQMFILYGDALAQRDAADRAAQARQRVSLYESAINLSPNLLEIYERLVGALLAVEKPTDEDAKFLEVGRRNFPQQGFIQIGLAQVAYRQGRRDEAMHQLDEALATNMPGGQRNLAVSLHDQWISLAMQEQVREALSKRQYAQARAALDSAEPRLSDEDQKRYVRDMRNSIDLQELVQQADTAARSRNASAARPLYEKLLARTDLPADLRQYAERALATLKRAH